MIDLYFFLKKIFDGINELKKKFKPNLAKLKSEDKENPNFLEEHEKKIQGINDELSKLFPKAKSKDQLSDVEHRYNLVCESFEKAKNKAREAKESFLSIKNQRNELFMKAFAHISKSIDGIYKELTKVNEDSIGGTAYLNLSDSEEPYNEGISYHAMPPLKRFRDMEQLSGGEKTIASLALFFAIQSYRESPFLILDEVDAALDNVNVQALSRYLEVSKAQFIVISLKLNLFERADVLFGVYRDKTNSGVLSLDLREYD